jgi:hypothetical protein
LSRFANWLADSVRCDFKSSSAIQTACSWASVTIS